MRRERARAQGIAVDELEDFYRKRNILARPILPEDVAEAVLFLASDRSAKTTGCTLTVDGGVKDAFPGREPMDPHPVRRVPLACTPPARAVRAGAARGGAGLDSLWTGDHVSFHNPIYESLTLLAVLRADHQPDQARHRRLPAGPAPARRRGQDHLHARRALAAAGSSSASGWAARTRRSSRPAGCPTTSAGARVTEGIDVVRALWRDTPASFKGRFTQFEGVSIDPKPVQRPGPPIWIGGRSDAALARAGRQGDGLDVLCRPARALRPEPGQDPAGRGGSRAEPRRLRGRPPRPSSRSGATTRARSAPGCASSPVATRRTSARSRASTG